MTEKRLIILGSTGSVGTQSISVARQSGYSVVALSANKNVDLVEKQIREFHPAAAAMSDIDAASDLKIRVADLPVKIYSGSDGIIDMIHDVDADVAVNAIIGMAGLMPTLAVIDKGIRLALSNKESLVIAGDIVMSKAKEKNVLITPVDSEHSAIFQCLRAGEKAEVEELIVTASGGPFRGMKREDMKSITPERALAHPVWKMGAHITIDSATLMNKGFEVIEAAKLFDISADKISVLVHPQSIVHSMVRYKDNSVIAQMSVPDMRLCVQYAVEWPERKTAVIDKLELAKIASLTFEAPDEDTFSPLKLARKTLLSGGALPAVLHAANDIAVDRFLEKKCPFTAIFDTLEAAVDEFKYTSKYTSLEDILESSCNAERFASHFIEKNYTL